MEMGEVVVVDGGRLVVVKRRREGMGMSGVIIYCLCVVGGTKVILRGVQNLYVHSKIAIDCAQRAIREQSNVQILGTLW